MSNENEKELVGPCGLSCGHCYFHMLNDNPAVADLLVSRGFSREKLQPCKGCRASGGKTPNVGCTKETMLHELPAAGSSCQTYTCSVEHGVDFCYQCAEFPCVKLQPSVDMAKELPHNMKLFYLSYIQKQGLTQFLKNYSELNPRYYFGKMVIGKGPQLSDEELKKILAQLQSMVMPGKA